MNRRDFLRALSAAGVCLPGLPAMAALQESAGSATHRNRYLVLIELQGGNDGLNTVVPFADPDYARLRPTIGFRRDRILQLDEHTGLHRSLEPLMQYWQRGELAIIQGVGYAKANRSHFRSIEIWETASDADEILLDGWLDPVVAALQGQASQDIKALALADDEGPLAGATSETVVFNRLDGFLQQATALPQTVAAQTSPALDHILAVENATRTAASQFARRLDDLQDGSAQELPRHASLLVKQLDLIATLIRNEVGPQVFKVQLGGFDTHVNQLRRHENLLKQLAQGVVQLETSLASTSKWQDVLVMTYSEFGRRAAENGNGGTDHGTAAPHFMIGGGVKGGLYGRSPQLDRLENEDLRFSTDFRELYSTVSRNWFNQSLASTPFAGYPSLPVIRSV